MATNADADSTTVSVDRLRQELGESTEPGPQNRSERVLNSVIDELFPDQRFTFEEEMVKGSLDELLLVLVALREEGTHGKGLMEDLSTLFDARLSPGTVYPRLHEMSEEGDLEMHELVRTKEYQIDDHEQAREQAVAAMHQHLALGLFLRAALEEFPEQH